MWIGIGIKMAQEAWEQAQAPQDVQQAEQPSTLSTIGDLATTWGVPAATAVPESQWGRLGQFIGGRTLGPALSGVGKKLPMGLNIVAGIPAAWSEAAPGGDVPATQAEGATPGEEAYVQAARRGDRDAWRYLPAGHSTQSTGGAISGLINAPLAVLPWTAAATWAGQIPGYLSSGSRIARGDPREHFYNPEMMRHLFARRAGDFNYTPGKVPGDNRGFIQRYWEDELRPTGNVLNQAITRPGQTIASGTGMVAGDVGNVWKNMWRKPTEGVTGAPPPPAPAPPPAVAKAPVPKPPVPPPVPGVPKPPSTVT